MNIMEMAECYYKNQQMNQELGGAAPDAGDEIYCRIGKLLQEVANEELAGKIDMLILEMSEADQKEYFVKGFKAGVQAKEENK